MPLYLPVMVVHSITHSGAPLEALAAPQKVPQQALAPPLPELLVPGAYYDAGAQPSAANQRPNICTRIASRVAGAALAGYLLLAEARPAAAAPPDAISAEAPSQGSGVGWGNIFAGLGLLVTAAAIIRQTNEKTADRFHAALQGIKGESTGEERLARLNALEPFAARRGYASEVFAASVAYLRGRRGGLLKLQQQHEDKPNELENAITERRNADRTALRLFLETLPKARQRMRRQELIKRIAKRTKIINIIDKEEDEQELQRIDELTGLQIDAERHRVNARAINLDDMRGEVQNCNLSDVDLTGAGLQRNDIRRVSFRGARLCEVQLEGSQLSNCSLEGADFRAAYLGDADYCVFETCIIDAGTRFGNLPDNHPNARFGKLDPAKADEYRGVPNAVLRDLRSTTLSQEQIVEMVREWQRNGLVLRQGSSPGYF